MTPAQAPVSSSLPPPLLGEPAGSRADGLIAAMDDLGDVLRKETACLRAQDYAAVRALSELKARMVRHYEDAVRRMRVEEDLLRSMTPEARAAVQAASARFRQAADENQSILKAALRASQLVVNTMVSTINKERVLEGTYTARGGMAMAQHYGRRTAPVAPATFSTRC